MRSKENHEKDIRSKSNGVKEQSIFQSLPGFDIFRYVSYDAMHDSLEGICRYELWIILYYLIFVEKHFTYTQFK